MWQILPYLHARLQTAGFGLTLGANGGVEGNSVEIAAQNILSVASQFLQGRV